MSRRVSFSICKKCNKTINIAELKDNPDGIGFICTDLKACRERQEKSRNQHK